MQLLIPHIGGLGAGGEEVLTGTRPCYRAYACRGGGAVALGALEPKFWAAFCRAVGKPAWEARGFDSTLSPEAEALFRGASRDEWVERLAAVDCCLEPVLEPRELRDHPQHRARGAFLADGNARSQPALSQPASCPAPRLGENTGEILREHGFSDGEIDDLRAARAIA